jgi:hypothetical protein
MTFASTSPAPRRATTGRTRDFVVLSSAWVVTRITMVCLLVVDAEVAGTSDVRRYHAVAEALVTKGGERPVDVWEYPLGALLVVVVPLALGASAYVDYLLAFVAVSVALDLATFAGVLMSSPRGSVNRFGGWIWVMAPLALGLVSITRLDVAACALAACGLSLSARRHNDGCAGVLLVAGALVKVWPGLLLLPVLAWSRGWSRALYGALGAGALALIVVHVAHLWYLSTSFLEYQRDRGIQIESFPALPLLWLDQMGVVDYSTRFEFGARHLQGPGTDVIAALASIVMILALTGVAVFTRTPRVRALPHAERVLLAGTLVVLALVITNKVFSSQYILWVAVMIAALSGWRRADLRTAAARVLAAALTHVVYPLRYGSLIAGELAPLMVLTARDLSILYIVWRLVACSQADATRNNAGSAPATELEREVA